MRKILLLLLCIVLVSFCPSEYDYPLIDQVSSSQVMTDLRRFLQHSKHEQSSHGEDSPAQISLVTDEINQETGGSLEGGPIEGGLIEGDSVESALKEGAVTLTTLLDKATKALLGSIDEPEKEEAQPLDLSLPDLELHSQDYSRLETGMTSEDQLPDLFATELEAEKDSRASIGGRLLLDEDNPNYSMEAVMGAEVSLELKTH